MVMSLKPRCSEPLDCMYQIPWASFFRSRASCMEDVHSSLAMAASDPLCLLRRRRRRQVLVSLLRDQDVVLDAHAAYCVVLLQDGLVNKLCEALVLEENVAYVIAIEIAMLGAGGSVSGSVAEGNGGIASDGQKLTSLAQR